MKSKPSILVAHRQPSACGYYRMWVPARYLQKKGYKVTWWEDQPYFKAMKPSVFKWISDNAHKFNLVLCDRAIQESDLGACVAMRHHAEEGRMIVDFDDDFCNIPPWNQAHEEYKPAGQFRRMGLAHLKLDEMNNV